MHGPGRLTAVVAAAALALVGAGACGGDDAPDRTADLTPDQILAQSAAAAESLDAFRLSGDATVRAEFAPGTVPAVFQQLLAQQIRLTGEGPVNGSDATIDLDVQLPALPPLQVNVTKVGGELYVGFVGTDYRVDVPAEQVAAVTPGSVASSLLGWITDPVEVGREEIDGTPTVKLRGELDPDAVLTDITGLIGSLQGSSVSPEVIARSRAQFERALVNRTIEVWIGTEDLLPRRVTGDLSAAGRVAALPQLRSALLQFTVTLSDIGEQVEITAPATTETLDLDRLSDLTGG